MRAKYYIHEYNREKRDFDVHEEIRDEPDDERHRPLCYMCGNKSYPQCRSWCPHGEKSQSQE